MDLFFSSPCFCGCGYHQKEREVDRVAFSYYTRQVNAIVQLFLFQPGKDLCLQRVATHWSQISGTHDSHNWKTDCRDWM